jgi:hypothetical protein
VGFFWMQMSGNQQEKEEQEVRGKRKQGKGQKE